MSAPPDACSTSCAAPRPSSRSASEKPVGSLTPFFFEHASHRSTFCILSPTICVRCTVASASLQMLHSMIVFQSLYRLAGRCRQGVVSPHQVAENRTGPAAANHAPVDLNDGDQFRAGPGEKTFIGIEEVVAREVRLRNRHAGGACEF